MVRPCRLLAVIIYVGSSVALATAALAERVTLHAAAEAGPELDTNALRVNQPSGVYPESPLLAPLLRLSASAGIKARLFRRQLLTIDYGGGGKLFLTDDSRRADELVQYAGAGWGLPLGQHALWVNGTYYDAFQRLSTRDFRTGTAGLELLMDGLPARLRAAFDLGYRGLAYKPLSEYSFHGMVGGVGLSWRGTSGPEHAPTDWEVRAGYAAGLRFFAGPIVALPERCNSADQPFPCNEPGTARRDLHHQLRFEGAYLGTATAALAYTLEVNRSNSYGESYLRHALGLRFTAALTWGLFLTAKATLQLSRFQDPFLVSQVSTVSFVSIDDENRSSLIVQLAKELGEHWAINLRWGLYVNESAAQGNDSSATADTVTAALIASSGFFRQTLFLGIRFEYGK